MSDIARIKSLRHLHLHQCESIFTGFYELVVASQLESLWLEGCDYVTDERLEILSRSKTLRQLTLINPYCSSEGLAHLGALTQLEHLTIHGADVTEEAVKHWGSLKRLHCLDILEGKLTDEWLRVLAQIPTLTCFRFEGRDLRFTEAGIKTYLMRFQQLEEIKLATFDYRLNNHCLEYLGQLPNLKRLSFHRAHFSWEGMGALAQLQHLDELYLDFSDLGMPFSPPAREMVASDISQFPGVRSLRMCINGVTDDGLSGLFSLRLLEELDLSHAKVTSGGLQVLKHLTHLRSLDLSRCEGVDDEVLACLAGMKELTHLRLEGCDQLTDEGLQHLAGLGKLEYLNLKNCIQITDRGISHLAELPRLKYLNLTLCSQISDIALSYLSNARDLVEFFIYKCQIVTDAGMSCLYGCRQLRYLDILHCTKISSACKSKLEENNPGIYVRG